MTYTIDLSGDPEQNEVFLLLKNIILESKKNAKGNTKKSLLLLLQKIVESETGEPGEMQRQIAVALAKAETDEPSSAHESSLPL
ncbi:MAG: hypothetical protein LBJ11_03015 [Oscillospiraceae bacterium]|jgi:hypothetical protein|nr:hypothetical protein [Oscillospiraceae bacterium]